MISIQNRPLFLETVTEAIRLSAQKYAGKELASIVKQIAHAVAEIESNPLMSFEASTQTLRTVSRHSCAAYKVTTRGCFRADGSLYPAKNICFHRIARRLLIRYHEAVAARTVTLEISKPS